MVIDHYVPTPQKLEADIRQIAILSGGKIVLGEFGVPIPDIHGKLTEEAQSIWVDEALQRISKISELVGVNYWTSVGGSTEIWNEDGSPEKAVEVLTYYYTTKIISGRVVDELGKPIKNVRVSSLYRNALTESNGEFSLVYLEESPKFIVSAEGYFDKQFTLDDTSVTKITL